ncbi:MAG: leucyl/phenylalanyl-tRNA--protein transferase [Bacteroidetes bacterium]|jgi:leucyl/phenylalanyl-tRNA---protein transferase|nr:leucyl/phenylalanyl-tRNA--protein transferase [Bacteroidota bacterium]
MPVQFLDKGDDFPDTRLAEPEGLLAYGGEINPERLLKAYPLGIFPWYNEGQPILWWAPHDRCVLIPDRMHCSKNLRSIIRQGRFEVRMDHAFDKVVQACGHVGSNRASGTWLNSDLKQSLSDLHDRGFAHSVEAWRNGKLVGGLYGVSLGGIFFGESMFAAESDASKVCLYHLCQLMIAQKMDVIDCQIPNDHLMSLGAEMMERSTFYPLLEVSTKKNTVLGPWKPVSS